MKSMECCRTVPRMTKLWKLVIPTLIILGLLYMHQIYPKYEPANFSFMMETMRNRSILTAGQFNLNHMVVVTGADSSHFTEAKDAIASAQKQMPKYKLLFYDLGLLSHQVTEVKSWCGVTYVKFDFSRYPPHVRNLYNYAWKMLILQEVLQENHGVTWFDSSIRFKCEDPMSEIETTLRKHGICMVLRTGHSIFSATDSRLYKFLPTNLTLIKQKEILGGGLIFLINTHEMFDNVMEQTIRCALSKDCMAPDKASIYCKFKGDRYTEYANCHRYDMSVLNILLHNHFNGDMEAFTHNETCFATNRYATKRFKLQIC